MGSKVTRAAAVVALAGLLPASLPAQAPRRLSAFDRRTAEWLLRERLPCLGCHRWDGEGGVIGPDLSTAADRRTDRFLMGLVSDPQAALPGSRMPRIPMPAEWRALVVSLLAERRSAGATPADPKAPADSARLSAITDGAVLYGRVCAGCHGAEGKGDGFNAANLPVRPTAHADSGYMASRPDNTLFDGIFGGGYLLNKSNRMPAWGETLSREQIWALVGYLRRLCRCTGPAWSRKGGKTMEGDE